MQVERKHKLTADEEDVRRALTFTPVPDADYEFERKHVGASGKQPRDEKNDLRRSK